MTRLILIRHGETDFNAANIYCGHSDPPLNQKGKRQAELAAARFKGISIDTIYSSDLKRALESAKIIFKDKKITKHRSFREINLGKLEGLTNDEVALKYPEFYQNWIDYPSKVKVPGGESLEDFEKRVIEKLQLVISGSEGLNIAIVCHGGPIRVILCQAFGYKLDKIWQIDQDNGAINIIDYSKGSKPIVVKINDTSHL